jgi:hypothetical protein
MKKYFWPLIVVLITFVGVGAAEYVKIANERGRLLGQLNEAAVVVSANPPESAEARAAMERGTMIVVGWPCHWWEDRQSVRSKATEVFENLVALKRQSNAQADPTTLSNQATENQ